MHALISLQRASPGKPPTDGPGIRALLDGDAQAQNVSRDWIGIMENRLPA